MKQALRWVFLVVATALLAWALVSTWDDVTAAWRSLTWGAIAGAFALTLVALVLAALAWREVMRAVGLDATVPEALRVFLLSQIGKYVPGSVWPVIAQAEFARDHGVSRARAMTGSLVAMVVGAVTAAIVGTVGLIISVPGALAEYWWVIVVAVGLAACLVPAVLVRIVGVAFRVTRRTEQPVRIGARPLLAAVGLNVVQWLVLGAHAWLLLRELAPGTDLILATGAFAFAWLVGFVVVIAPAGAGAREAALVLALQTVATQGAALSLALISRFLMTLADVTGLGVGLVIGALRRRNRADNNVDVTDM